jgi:hypothetical protein
MIALNQGFVDHIINQGRQFGVVEVSLNPSLDTWVVHRHGVITGVSCNQTMISILYKNTMYMKEIDDILVTREEQDYLLDLPSHRHLDHANGRQLRPACTREQQIQSLKQHAMALCRLALPNTRPLASDVCVSIMSYLLQPEALKDIWLKLPMDIERPTFETRADRRLRRNKRKHEAVHCIAEKTEQPPLVVNLPPIQLPLPLPIQLHALKPAAENNQAALDTKPGSGSCLPTMDTDSQTTNGSPQNPLHPIRQTQQYPFKTSLEPSLRVDQRYTPDADYYLQMFL